MPLHLGKEALHVPVSPAVFVRHLPPSAARLIETLIEAAPRASRRNTLDRIRMVWRRLTLHIRAIASTPIFGLGEGDAEEAPQKNGTSKVPYQCSFL
jgi:hypothetical protein